MSNSNITKVVCPVCGSEISIAEHEHTVSNATVVGKDSGLGTVALPLAKKNKADERLAALKAAGVDTTGLFAMQSASGEGMVVRLKDGVPSIVNDDDPIYDIIVKSGTIPERRLFRRWVMAQMLRMEYGKRPWDSAPAGFQKSLEWHGYEYQWSMLENELKVQSRLSGRDNENFCDRNRWFDKELVLKMCDDYMEKLKKHVDRLATRKCKGQPYKRVCNTNIFVDDLYKKVYSPLYNLIGHIRSAETPFELANAVSTFNQKRMSLGWPAKQCKEWQEAYKGVGAYYTLTNLIRFHRCLIKDKRGVMLTKHASLEYVKSKAIEYAISGEGYKMLGILRQTIKDNNFDVQARFDLWDGKFPRR